MSESISINPIGSQISKWGEGPIYWQDHLVYVDIEGHSLISLDPKAGTEKIWEMGERIGTVVPRVSGGFMCAGDSGIYSFDPQTGDKKHIADPEAEKRPDNRFNDGKCDPHGRFWAGTISTVKKTGDANLYMLDHDGILSLKVPEVTNSNGICWNAEATQMFYIDTPTKEIRAYPYDDSSGSIGEAESDCKYRRSGMGRIPGWNDHRCLGYALGGHVSWWFCFTNKSCQRLSFTKD